MAESGIDSAFFSDGKRFDSLVDAIRADERLSEFKPSLAFQGKLRPYQARGAAWLDFLGRLGFGALLADDMGLGKTVQVIAYAVSQAEAGNLPILVVCPTSVISNWAAEFSGFAPSLKVKIHHGSTRSGGQSFQADAKKADVVITSYALAWRDQAELSSIHWALAVLDEAQSIKNPFSKQARHVNLLKADRRIALTGTPVENRLSDLWSIMHFLNPGYLKSWMEFKEKFANPIEVDHDARKKEALRNALGSFILRRLKTDRRIITDLPEKVENVERCYLTSEQATLYQAVVDASIEKIDQSADDGQKRMEIFSAITKLKQICNHPSNFLKDSRDLADRSGKVERLREMLSEIVQNGESCLVFSQYAEMASLLYENLRRELPSAEFYFLHGGLERKKRDGLLHQFARGSGTPKVMVLSLKAGGVGLNLTQASNVIHFDRWWNPAVENQATDRAFRIGQDKRVFVHKFVTRGTIEERIEQILERKRSLADSVISSGEGIFATLQGRNLRELFELRQD